ncbi:MAG: hypothetical protein O7J95_03850 [Planctomycetota bacterium]|nr:hypothetical protein [Planctomycetota bacterium]
MARDVDSVDSADDAGSFQLEDLEFPTVSDQTLEEVDVLCLLAEAHGELQLVYERLVDAVRGETAFVARLLRNDWTSLTASLLESVRDLHAELAGGAGDRSSGDGGGDGKGENPAASRAGELVGRLGSLSMPSFVAALEDVARRYAVCMQLVPVGSVSSRTRELFRQCLEAEDQHLSQLAWLRATVGGGSSSETPGRGQEEPVDEGTA